MAKMLGRMSDTFYCCSSHCNASRVKRKGRRSVKAAEKRVFRRAVGL